MAANGHGHGRRVGVGGRRRRSASRRVVWSKFGTPAKSSSSSHRVDRQTKDIIFWREVPPHSRRQGQCVAGSGGSGSGRAAGGEGGFVGRILLLIASTSALVGGGCHDVKVAVNMSMVDVIAHSDHLFPMIVLGLVHGEIFF